MNDLTIFDFESYKVRVVVKNGEPWWILKDVCCVLDLSSPHKVSDRLDEDERSLIPLTDSTGRLQKTIAVNESGLYSVIIRSDKPTAKKFRKWVTSEVLHGKPTKVQYRQLDLTWKPLDRIIRFVVISSSLGKMILLRSANFLYEDVA